MVGVVLISIIEHLESGLICCRRLDMLFPEDGFI